MKQAPLLIYLGQELWSDELVARLVTAGHTVQPTGFVTGSVIISRDAWRVPKQITAVDLTAHIDMVVKQARLLKHEDTTKDAQPEQADGSAAVPAKRKRAAASGTKKRKSAKAAAQPSAASDTAGTQGLITEGDVDAASTGC